MALINCIDCKSQISDKAKHCPKCGAPVQIIQKIKCFECGTELIKGTKDCSNCGAEQLVTTELNESKINSNQHVNEAISTPQNKNLKWVLVGVLLIITFMLSEIGRAHV